MSTSKRQRRQHGCDFQFHDDSDDENRVSRPRLPPHTLSRHTDLYTGDHGLSAQTSFIATIYSTATASSTSLTNVNDTTTSSLPESEGIPNQESTWDNSDLDHINVDYIHELPDMDEGLKRR